MALTDLSRARARRRRPREGSSTYISPAPSANAPRSVSAHRVMLLRSCSACCEERRRLRKIMANLPENRPCKTGSILRARAERGGASFSDKNLLLLGGGPEGMGGIAGGLEVL